MSAPEEGKAQPGSVRFPLAVRAVVIDLDGTLIHTGPDLAHATNLMLRDLGRETYPEETVQSWIGNGAVRLVKRALTGTRDGEPDPELFERGHALFHDHYLAGVAEHSEPYPDVVAALGVLRDRGFHLACVTNKPDVFTRPLLAELELDGFFEHILSGDSLPEKKPHPLPLHHTCELFGIQEAEAVLVGDSINDIQAARAAGMPVVCVSYGYNQGVDLTGYEPDAIIDSFKELPGMLEPAG